MSTDPPASHPVVTQLHERAVANLVETHAQNADEPLLLAVRYRQNDPTDIYLLEVLGGFPGGDDDELFTTEFDPSANLRILGKLHLTLCSSAQLRAAHRRRDAIVEDIERGVVLHQSEEGAALAKELGLA